MSSTLPDPIRKAAELISAAAADAIERRLKKDIMNSIARIKPALVRDIDFEAVVMSGDLFATLDAPLQGIAISKTEGALAFYNRVGWNPAFLAAPLSTLIDAEHQLALKQHYNAQTLHDLAYVHPKHMEKVFGKSGAAALWENLKRYSSQVH